MKVPFYTTLTPDNEEFLRSLPERLGEPTISAAVNRLLDEARGYTKTELWDYLEKIP